MKTTTTTKERRKNITACIIIIALDLKIQHTQKNIPK
jgi:hypothetical protein